MFESSLRSLNESAKKNGHSQIPWLWWYIIDDKKIQRKQNYGGTHLHSAFVTGADFKLKAIFDEERKRVTVTFNDYYKLIMFYTIIYKS